MTLKNFRKPAFAILSASLLSSVFNAVPARADMQSPRSERLLKDWQFSRDSLQWNNVTVPHDWAIYGPFDRKYDLQKVAVEQNGETEETWKTGCTGGLPYLGKGYYRTSFNLSDTTGRAPVLLFDGAMSHARVKVNGREVAYWPYGYNSFTADLKGAARPGENIVEVSLENMPQSSRWYPGAGLYRNVHLIDRNAIHIPVWGTYVTTPHVGKDYATVRLETEVEGAAKNDRIVLSTEILDPQGRCVAKDSHEYRVFPGTKFHQNFRVDNPDL